MSDLRVGIGTDVHAFASGRPLWLAGVMWPDEQGLAGHSDADVAAHAMCDAVLSASGLGDLGSHFPDTDERWRGADSLELLAEVVRLLHEDGWSAVNVDCSVIAERSGSSATDEAISTPRFIGPGCITKASGAARSRGRSTAGGSSGGRSRS